ncbi:glycoside hydrolase family 2 TIM barrel-domain containing protein [Paenibacillus sp. 11B]|uniref:beta-mannosidase n=1 Tax=Paenibacillus sp. 11B TaxID=3060965 RepID=UPI00264F3CA0|nr:sugar-binding domain-containing protein [Paenibacillus sp. 11B]MDN8588161.1 glycoside hydrolase family 2 TIM barrel-domain containing protein [Paenibacillus sp. 11B]
MSRVVKDLSGKLWQMEKMRVGEGEREGFHLLPAERQGVIFSWNYASVPGDVYTDLQRAGELEDPYFGRNMHKAKWVQEYEWWYIRRFNVSEKMKSKKVHLDFEGVDYCCTIWLNGNLLGSHEGMFSPFSFEVSEYLNFDKWAGGSNQLAIKLDPPPKNFRNVGGKKVNFSGDYFTGLVPFGIWRPVRLVATDAVRILNHRTESDLKDSGATVHVQIDLHNMTPETQTVQLQIAMNGHNFTSETISRTLETVVKSGTSSAKVSVEIADAKLWWPWDMGTPHLYDIEIKVLKNGTELDRVEDRIGIRTVHMEQNPGFTPEESEYPWTFVINGKRQFLRSACWGGQPSFLYGRNSTKKYEHLLTLVKDCNINNLRIFGWHPPEIPTFYRLCDELGITVWTNFTFSTQAFSDDPVFIESASRECVEIVVLRRNHPSNIYWMGGEEVFFTDAHVESGNKGLMEAIGVAIEGYTSVPYGLASPLSNVFGQSMGFKPKESQHANEHYYGGGRNFMEEYYPSLDCSIIPELTAASAPSIESLKKFIPENELWPMGPSWGYHWADIHILQGLNIEVFGDKRMDSLEQFVKSTQIAQGTILQFALEMYRRRKPRMSGVSLCHFITNWPDIKWGLVDYYGLKKLSFDFVKTSYQPLLPSLAFPKRRWKPEEMFHGELWIVNDFQKAFENTMLEWTLRSHKDEVVQSGKVPAQVAPNSSSKFSDIAWKVDVDAVGEFKVSLILKQGDSVLARNEYKLLIGDLAEAKRICNEHLDESEKKLNEFGSSYYRYNPDLWELE